MRIVYSKKIAVGVDIGGTKMRAGFVDTNGQIIGIPESIRTLAYEPNEVVIEQLTLLIRGMIQQTDGVELIGIGIGSAGPLSINEGIILECSNLPALHDYPLRKKVESASGLPVELDNDANAMMLGEVLWGAGRNLNSILGITLSIGLGVTVVISRKIVCGATGCAGEIWLSPCKEGMIEDYVPGTGISNLYQRITKREISGEEISKLTWEGDINALKTWKEFTQALAYAFSWTVNIVDPEIVIIGDSVMRLSDIFWDSMVSLLKKYTYSQTTADIQLKPVGLKDGAGSMGAAALMFVE